MEEAGSLMVTISVYAITTTITILFQVLENRQEDNIQIVEATLLILWRYMVRFWAIFSRLLKCILKNLLSVGMGALALVSELHIGEQI